MNIPFTKNFEYEYNRLNPEQKAAVEEIYGPVMVVAGPGTGKTQILSARIGNILQKTDSAPHNILCLTYTEAGALNMRKRLQSFIGPAAYNVHIYTFHGFCNRVIQENTEVFGGYLDLQPLDELERIEAMIQLIDDLPFDHALKRLKGDKYYDKNRLLNLFTLIKREHWDPDTMIARVDDYLDELPKKEGFYYKRANSKKGIKAGDPNPRKIEPETRRMEQLKAATRLFSQYRELLENMRRYDYEDMILWVLEAFQQNQNFLARYREQYQFILVDEYQDTNGSQNDLLMLMAGPAEDKPNVFVVGDDDQAIFRFQGANIKNIEDFNFTFQEFLTMVVLRENYRSAPAVLEVADQVIRRNTGRLVNRIPELDKTLVARGDFAQEDRLVSIQAYETELEEEIGIYRQIRDLLDNGVSPSEIAVIYRKHAHIERLAKKMQIEGIPYQIRRPVDILHEPLIRHLVQILRYLAEEMYEPFSGEPRLFEMLYYPYWGIPPLDIARMALWIRRQEEKPKWREFLSTDPWPEGLSLDKGDGIRSFASGLEAWLAAIPVSTVQTLLERIVDEGGILDAILRSDEGHWQLQVLNTFYDYLKDVSAKIPGLTLRDFVGIIDTMAGHQVSIPVQKTLMRSDGVMMVTAHSAKGQEFEYVFILGANKEKWEGSRSSQNEFRLPDTIVPSLDENKEEEERRLFYVAMTRAERQLVISWAESDSRGKAMEQSVFVAEAQQSERQSGDRQEVDKGLVREFVAHLFRPVRPDPARWFDDDWVDEKLESFQLSPTALNKYLECPLAFYFENVLRVPRARVAAMGFGSAAHHALEHFFLAGIRDGKLHIPPEDELIRQFESGMSHYHSHFTRDEYEDLLIYGRQVLKAYYQDRLPSWKTLQRTVPEYAVKDAHIGGVPVSGKFDRVDFYESGTVLLDYKTGKPQYATSRLKPPQEDPDGSIAASYREETDPDRKLKWKKKLIGEDYWRQLVFYKLLMDADGRNGWAVHSGEVSFIEPDQYDRIQSRLIEINPSDEEIVREQIRSTYQKIRRKEFEEGCGRERCQWCGLWKERQI